MNIQNLDVSHKREGWRDWFIIDKPVKSVKLYIWATKQNIFRIDPTFDFYEVTGSIDKDDPPVFILTYMFEDEMAIRKCYIYSYRMKDDITKYFKIALRKKNNKLVNEPRL